LDQILDRLNLALAKLLRDVIVPWDLENSSAQFLTRLSADWQTAIAIELPGRYKDRRDRVNWMSANSTTFWHARMETAPNRREKQMLHAYDQAREQACAHKLKTYQGNAAEAEFRKWLSEFLLENTRSARLYRLFSDSPTRSKLPHYDVIIFDALESPVLWIEPHGGSDGSRAIPAETVRAVIEVKSALEAATIKEAMEHLND